MRLRMSRLRQRKTQPELKIKLEMLNLDKVMKESMTLLWTMMMMLMLN
jgi:hypothetical protein